MSHDGATLAIGTNRGTAEIWSIETLNLEKRFQVTEWSIYAVALSPDSTMLASCAADGTVQLWNIENSKRLETLGKKGAYRMSSMSFSPDSKVLATLTRDGRADMWDVVNGQLIGTLPTNADSWGCCSITFCPDANTVAIATPGLVLFWKPQNNNQVQRIEEPDSINPWKAANERTSPDDSRPLFVGMVVLSRDCKKAASVIKDGTIVVWDVQTRTVQLKLVGSRIPDLLGGGIEIMAFSPDKSLFASGNRNGNVQLWKLADRIKSKKPRNMKRQLNGTVEIPAGWTTFPGLPQPGVKSDVPVEN
jgi:WD40 repeat protein